MARVCRKTASQLSWGAGAATHRSHDAARARAWNALLQPELSMTQADGDLLRPAGIVVERGDAVAVHEGVTAGPPEHGAA